MTELSRTVTTAEALVLNSALQPGDAIPIADVTGLQDALDTLNTSVIFDGGNATSDYSAGPVFDCGGV